MSGLIVSLAAKSALALVVVASIARSGFGRSSRPERAAALQPRRVQISPTAFLLSRRARQAFFEQVRVEFGFALRPADRLPDQGTKASLDAKVSAGDRVWLVSAPSVRQPFEHVLASNRLRGASGRRKAARREIGWPMVGKVKRPVGPVSTLRPDRHATRHWPATVRASA